MPLVLLAACSGGEPAARRADGDPEVIAALAEPLMTDPDLTGQSNASAALGGGGPARAEIPPELRDPKVVEAIREEAEKVAGAVLASAPVPAPGKPLPPTVTAPQFAALLPGARGCAAKAGFGFIWAAALPAAFPVYPRGHSQVAAGNDLDGCKLRSVVFTTPVAPEQVAAFYLARGKSAGLPLDYSTAGDALVLAGSKGKAAVLVKLQTDDDGFTVVELATSGL